MKHVQPPPVPPIDDLIDERLARVVEHPDGWYWVAPDGHQQFGPFEIHGDAPMMQALDELLRAFVEQRRMKIAGEYQPCYRVVT